MTQVAPYLAAILAAAASVALAPWALAFDPQAWLVWGRDLPAHGLQTAEGPSWKPLPMLVTTPLALAGDAAPALWSVVARAGALLALVAAWRLGRRLGGVGAGVGAVVVTALAPWWAYNGAVSNSEGWLAAAVLAAVAAHLEGRPRAAMVLGTVAGLLRPEIWPFLAVYGWWTWRRSPRLVAACAAVLAAAWFGPDVLGGGGAVSASDAARATPSPASAARAEHPALQVLADAATGAGIAVCVAALFAMARERAARQVGMLAVAYVALVAVATVAGYAGNPRYLVPALALIAVLAGVGAARTPRPVVALAVLVALTAWGHAGDLRTAARDVGQRDEARRGLDAAIAAYGGAARMRACGPVRTVAISRALVAWRAGVPLPPIKRWHAGRGTTLLPPPPSVLQSQDAVPRRGPPGQHLVVRSAAGRSGVRVEVSSRHGPASR